MSAIANSTQIFLVASGVAVGAGVTAILTTFVKSLALKYELTDSPNQRSMHVQPMPRVGGIAIAGGFLAGILYFLGLGHLAPETFGAIPMPSPWLLSAALFMFAVGLCDDLRNLKPRTKLAMQCVAALFVIAAGFRFNLSFLPLDEMGTLGAFISVAFTFLWIIGIVNALNLLDGLDGLAAGVTLIAMISISAAMMMNGALVDLVLVTCMIGALLGFLMHNKHPASIFMGDSGSLFLGFILATFALPVTAQPTFNLTFLVPIFALGLPITDTLVAIARRAFERRGIFSPDSDHIHHRIARRLGYSHKDTVHLLYGISLIFGLTAVLVSSASNPAAVALGLSLTASFVFYFLLKLGYIHPTVRIPLPANDETVAPNHPTEALRSGE